MKLAPFLGQTETPPQPPRKPRTPGQFSIGTVLVVMTCFAIALAAFQSSLGAGIGWLLLVLAVLIRTAVVEALRARHRDMGVSTSVVSELFMSVPLVMLAIATGSVVFCIGCIMAIALASGNGPPFPDPPLWPIGAGIVLGIVAGAYVLWLTRNAAKDI